MSQADFKLDKWFLDFVGEDGEAMIFYAAKLTWRGLTVPYASWLTYDPDAGLSRKSRFRKVRLPERKEDQITWEDAKFGVSGVWRPLSKPVAARLFETEEGCLDWRCFQPASQVALRLGEKTLSGRGYVEQLVLTAYPWKLPMDQLRWGRFVSPKDQLVWIEMTAQDHQCWLWWNGEAVRDPHIADDRIDLPAQNATLRLGREVVLESGKSIFAAVEKLLPLLPALRKIIPLKFLMADGSKWLSNGRLEQDNEVVTTGKAIHEFVNFKAG